MKKTVVALSIASLALAATPAFARSNHDKGDRGNRGFALGKVFLGLGHKVDKKVASENFIVNGTIASISSNTLVVTVKHQIHIPNLVNNQATVTVDANTKYTKDKKETIALTDVKVGNSVVIQGSVSGNTLTAKNVYVMMPKGKAYGEVTAKTDTSITLKNNVTGTSQTFTTDGDTKVKIDGEVKTTADVQVGDKGFLKFKTQVSGLFAKVVNLFR